MREDVSKMREDVSAKMFLSLREDVSRPVFQNRSLTQSNILILKIADFEIIKSEI